MENMKVNGKDYPIYIMENKKMFETTNQPMKLDDLGVLLFQETLMFFVFSMIRWMGQRNPNHQLKTVVNIPLFIGFQPDSGGAGVRNDPQ